MDDRSGNGRPRVVAIMGSQAKGGLLDRTVDEILAGARDHGAVVEKIALVDKNIEYCENCRQCCQQPGPHRGDCVKSDDLPAILEALDAADAVIFGAPVNCGDVNALTRTLLERMLGYLYWPSGQATPRARATRYTKRAALITASGATGIMTRYLARPFPTLRRMAQLVSARVVGTLTLDLTDSQVEPAERKLRSARHLGARLVRPAPRPRGALRTLAPPPAPSPTLATPGESATGTTSD